MRKRENNEVQAQNAHPGVGDRPSEERRHPYPGQILATPRYHMDLVLAFRWNESAVRRANAEIKQRYETLPGGLASTPALLAANAERARKEAKQAKQRTSTGTTAGARALGRIAAAQMDKEGKIMDAAGGRGAPGWRMKHKGGIVAGVLAAAVVVAALTMKSSSAPPKVDEKPQEEATGEPPESIANTPSSAAVADGEGPSKLSSTSWTRLWRSSSVIDLHFVPITMIGASGD